MRALKVLAMAAVVALASGCATTKNAGGPDIAREPESVGADQRALPAAGFSAVGYRSPGSEGEIVGTYPTIGDCEAALADWLQSQVVGNPVSGECLVVDTQ